MTRVTAAGEPVTESSAAFTDIIDAVTPATLRELAELQGPVVSILMPTRRDMTDTSHDSLLLRNLADEAEGQLRALGADVEAYLAPVRALVESTGFWRNQAEGLAIYATAEAHHIFRLPREVPAVAVVGDAARLVPLIRVATGDEAFHILAVAQNSVRLFDATRHSIHQRDLGAAPPSIDEMERTGTKEPELQHQHAPRGVASFHGHGGTDTSSVALEKFIADVAAGIRAQIGASNPLPLVLAGVAEHLPAFRSTGQLPSLLDESVTGNVEHLDQKELLEKAWPITRQLVMERREEMTERFGAAYGTGTAIVDPAKLRKAAEEGRIDTVVAAQDPPAGTGRPDATDDLAVAAALRTGASLAVADLPDGAPLGAFLRY